MRHNALLILAAIMSLTNCELRCDAALLATDSSTNTLLKIDPESGAGTLLANIEANWFGRSLAFNHLTSTFYGVSGYSIFDCSPSCWSLVSINVRNGHVALIGDSDLGVWGGPSGLAFNSIDHTLYGVAGFGPGQGGHTLIRIDPTIGSASVVGRIAEERTRFLSLAFDSATNSLYSIDTSSDELFVVNPETGVGTSIGSVGFDDIQGLGFDPVSGLLYGVDNDTNQLVAIDKMTGMGTAVGPVGSAFMSIGGFTVGIIPEPTSQVLLTIAGVAVISLRIRKVKGRSRILWSATIAALLVIATLSCNAHAQAFVNDNDGLLDVGEAPGFPADPAAAMGELNFAGDGIEDLDGTNLLTNLQKLNLFDNRIRAVEPGDFNGLSNLQKLGLGGNHIEGIEPHDFEGLINLQELELWGNQIESIEPGDFEGLDNLQTLDLGGNYITSIEPGDFDGLASVQTLDLRNNEITSIESGDFNGLTNLQTLYVSHNGIDIMEPGAFRGLKSLQDLSLDGNDLEELDFTGATFDNLRPWSLCFCSFQDGFFIGFTRERITSLLLDDAELSVGSFDAIVGYLTSIVDASLAGLTFTDENPDDLSVLLGIASLDNVRIDPALFSLYADELNAFAAVPGNTVTVVPEPSTAVLLALGLAATWAASSPRTRSR